jgi:phospholipid/cholesterol/gamma-HCH transport system ATP-binding protein
VLIAAGKITAEGTPDQLGRGETEWTKQFFGGEADGPVPFHYPAADYADDLRLRRSPE